jgi:small subunit ribosomal protein S21
MQNKPDNTKFDKVVKGNRVTVKEHENINQALRRFKKKIETSGVLEDLRKKEFYEKPTTERKRKKGAAKARWKKKLREQQLPPKLF